jgi:hypothetical protein
MKIEIVVPNAKVIAERWRQQYETAGWKTTISGNSEDIYKKLLTAKDNAEDINAIIGNKGWTTTSCRECGRTCTSVAALGNDGDSVKLCRYCLQSALAALDAVAEHLK